MLYVICGLIGAGKSAYAREHFRLVTDLDNEESKHSQIRSTRRKLQKGEDVAHITCYPTIREQAFFRTLQEEVRYIWIDTTPEQAEANILHRGRRRDMENMRSILDKNQELLYRKAHSSIDFEIVPGWRGSSGQT